MIMRIFHARVRAGKQAEFKKALELLTLPHIQTRQGMIAFYPGQPLGPDSDEFVLVTVWRSRKAREAQQDWARAIIPPEALPLLVEWREQGYQAFGITDQPIKPLFQNI